MKTDSPSCRPRLASAGRGFFMRWSAQQPTSAGRAASRLRADNHKATSCPRSRPTENSFEPRSTVLETLPHIQTSTTRRPSSPGAVMRNVTRQPSRAILSMTDARSSSSEQPKVIILPLPSQRKCHILHCLPVVSLFQLNTYSLPTGRNCSVHL